MFFVVFDFAVETAPPPPPLPEGPGVTEQPMQTSRLDRTCVYLLLFFSWMEAFFLGHVGPSFRERRAFFRVL